MLKKSTFAIIVINKAKMTVKMTNENNNSPRANSNVTILNSKRRIIELSKLDYTKNFLRVYEKFIKEGK